VVDNAILAMLLVVAVLEAVRLRPLTVAKRQEQER